MGLLDDAMEFMKTPEGIGVMSGLAGWAANARKGTPWNNVGRGALTGLVGYSEAQDKVAAESAKKMQQLQTQLALKEMLKKSAREDAKEARTTEIMDLIKGFQGGPGGSHVDIGRLGMLAGVAGVDGSNEILKFAELTKPPTIDPVQAARLQYETGQTVGQPPAAPAPRDVSGKSAVPPGMSFQDTPGLSPEEQAAVARWKQNPSAPLTIMGAPAPTFLNGMPPKAAQEARMKILEADRKRLDDMRGAVSSGRSTMKDLERFGTLNQQVATGGLQDKLIPDALTMDPLKQEMLAITAGLAPAQRPAGSGTTSDKDLALYLSALPGIDKSGVANKNIREKFSKDLESAKKRLDFAEQYLAQNGTLDGYEKAYEAANPPKADSDVMDLPQNPTAANLVKGKKYSTQHGVLEWDGMVFKTPKE